MPVKISVQSVLADKAFEAAKRRSEELNKNFKGQFAERRKIIELQARLSQTTDREERAGIRKNIAERRRGLQLAKLKEAEERGVTRELKQQIASQRRLNSLTRRLNRDLEKQQRQRSLLSRAGGAGGALALGAGVGVAALAGRAALEFAKDAEELGRQSSAAEKRLTALVGTSSEYNKLIKDIKVSTRGTIAETEAAESAFLLLDSGLAENNTEAAKLISTGRTLITIFEAQGASGEKFNRLLSSGNTALLDNFNLSLAQVNTRKSLIESTTDLSGEEAKLTAIKQLLIEKAEELEPTMDRATEAQARFDSASQDLTATIGQLLVPAMTTGREATANFLADVNTGLSKLQDSNEIFAEALKNLEFAPEFDTEKLTRLGKESAEFFAQLRGDLASNLANFENIAQEGGDLIPVLLETAFGSEQVGEAFTEAGKKTNEATDALNRNTEAAEDNADALEKLNAIRRDFVESLLDIDEKAQDDIEESWEDFYEEAGDAAEDHADRIQDLEEKAGKDRLKIGKKLAKDLKKVDADLARDLDKINRDTQKKIRRLQEDADRENRQESRKRKIDALGDERLFQFELQNLAADGEALAIQEAIKRREIEQQINAEKRQEEEQAEGDDLDVKIQRLRQDAEDQRREEEAQARDRRAALEEQAEEDRAQLEERLREEREVEAESLQERLDKLKDTNRERLDNIDESKQKAIAKLGEELAEAGELTETQLEALKPVAARLGEDVGISFAEGINKGYADTEQISQLLGGGGGPGARAGLGATPDQFQHGGSFTVGGVGGPDSQLVQFRATPGEKVEVRTPGQAAGGGGGGVTINHTTNITVPPGTGEEMLAEIDRRIAAGNQEIVTELENMIST